MNAADKKLLKERVFNLRSLLNEDLKDAIKFEKQELKKPTVDIKFRMRRIEFLYKQFSNVVLPDIEAIVSRM